jgi:glycosyltransferase involved in cell wall biosynthesis
MSTCGRLKIAFVADTVQSQGGGGIISGAYVVDRLRRDHDVITVAADGDDPLSSFQLPLRAMKEMRVVMAKPDRAMLARTFANVDVVHLQLPFWLSFAALQEARRSGVPIVAAFHVQPENALWGVGIRSPWLNRTLYRAVVDRLYNKVDAVVCPTAFAAQKLADHGLKTRAAVISNGVPTDLARIMAANPLSRPSSQAARFVVLAVGRFAAEKRQDVIIEAIRLSRHRDRIRLVLSGWGPLEGQLRDLAADLPNRPEIGFLSRADLLDAYRTADLFVHAGEVELEGMSVLEAMSAGLPAVIANAPESAASSFALNADFSFPAGDAAALAGKIDALIENPGTLAAARRPYREQARAFDFDDSVAKLVALYRTVIDEAGARRETA